MPRAAWVVFVASVALTGTTAFLACSSAATRATGGGGGGAGDGGHVEAGLADAGDAGDADASEVADGGEAGLCPDWTVSLPDAACSLPQGTECGGNEPSWAMFCWFRCCSGHWLAPTTPELCGFGGPPCSGWCDGGDHPVPCDGG